MGRQPLGPQDPIRVDSTPLTTALASRAFSSDMTPTELSRAMPANSPGGWGVLLAKQSPQGMLVS